MTVLRLLRCVVIRADGKVPRPKEHAMNKIEVILTKAKETKGTYVYEEDAGDGGKPPVLKTQYIQKWVLGSNPPDKIKVTIEAM
jgi:hypothetical protein